MPLQNRVTPTAEIVAHPARGLLMGNRGGALHGADRMLGARRWVTRSWICCRLEFNGRHRQVMAPGRYTELFFLDEATALAAGHRPCFECRRADAERFALLWSAAHGLPARARAAEMDQVLHAERLTADGRQRHHVRELAELPPTTMIVDPANGRPALVLEDALLPWHITGYCRPAIRPRRARVEALTPPGIIAVMKSGFRPLLHETSGISG
jgi:hypothetical protein